jgi:hypothetical protein
MPDVNEELVRRYFELQGYFVRTNVRYEFRTDKGMGWSDVDLCVSHPVTGDRAAVEVKGWHTERISASYLRDFPSLFHFIRPEAQSAVEEVLGTRDFRRVLVVGELGPRSRGAVLEYAQDRSVEVLEFPEVLQLLIERTPTNRDAGSEGEHVIRVLKIYGFLRDISLETSGRGESGDGPG